MTKEGVKCCPTLRARVAAREGGGRMLSLFFFKRCVPRA